MILYIINIIIMNKKIFINKLNKMNNLNNFQYQILTFYTLILFKLIY